MKEKQKNPEADTLFEAVLCLQTKDECRAFFEDLCTITEINAMEQRIEVAALLKRGCVYNDIVKLTGASTATISRINRCLNFGADGYKIVLDRMQKTKNADNERI